MTLMEAVNGLDALVQNTYSLPQKLRWLSDLDAVIGAELVETHEGGVPFGGYDETTPPDTPLLAEAPYDGIYLKYLEAQVHYYNGELTRYNNAMTAFNTLYAAFERRYNRTHLPLQRRRRFHGEAAL